MRQAPGRLEKFLEGLAGRLILRVRCIAWLNTPVEVEWTGPGRGPPPTTRLQQLRRDRADQRYEPRLPDVSGAGQLLEWFWDVGPASAGEPLTHAELGAWQHNTGFQLQSWQARLLRRMSQEFLAESERAKHAGCPAPCELPDFAPPTHIDPAEQMRRSIRAMAGA